jgi:NAD(P)H-hydrate epimerase
LRGISRETSRGVDQRATNELHIPSICLMENAAAGAAAAVLRLELPQNATVLCLAGPGNNGGDSMAVARHLSVAGRRVVVAILPLKGGMTSGEDSAIQLRIVQSMCIPHLFLGADSLAKKVPQMLSAADAVVDGLFGTGLDRPIRGFAADLVWAVNASGVPIVALDLPSGLDCDTGEPLGACVRASQTVTFVAPKLGFGNPASLEWTGSVSVVGIGAPLTWPLAP